jgi:hypothetical protein
MNIKFNRLSENDFNNTKAPILFEDKLTNRAFAIISNELVGYKIAWASDKVNPVIKYFDYKCLIGIDFNFIVLDFSIEKIIFNLNLNYHFYDIELHGNYIYLISEFEIFKIVKDDLYVEKIYDLPDTFESICFYDDSIIVSCLNECSINIK